MRRTTFDENRDQRAVDEAVSGGSLMCCAHGCPNRWTVDSGDRGIHRLCSAHAWSDRDRWPSITNQQRLGLGRPA
jgi:hypothetical protein